jgi:uncharacterized membrane protein YtjA (UPF0391 family)
MAAFSICSHFQRLHQPNIRCFGVLQAYAPDVDTEEVLIMLRWAVIFLVVALVAALLGFGGIAGAAAGIAKILFFVFLVLFVLALIFGRRVLSA